MITLSRKLTFSVCFILCIVSLSKLNAQNDSSVLIPQSIAGFNSEPVVFKTKRYKPHYISSLNSVVNETSGLLYFSGQIWTFNDSGNKPEIYQVDSTTGMVLRTIVIRNAVNTDWESVAQDESSIYIGDFGNNAGKRRDLQILKFSKTDILNPACDTVQAGFIFFNYPDQTVFATAFGENNFDCEAFFFRNDSLHLFCKNWSDLHTKHYVLSADTGNYTARLSENFNVDGLITDASINGKGSIVLLGYKKIKGRKYTCFTWLLTDYDGSFYFGGNKRRVELGSALRLGQTEGIVLKNNNTGWISAESIRLGCIHKPAKLFGFDFREYFDFGME